MSSMMAGSMGELRDKAVHHVEKKLCSKYAWSITIIGTIIAVLLFPGFIISLPPVPPSPKHTTCAQRIFFTGEVTIFSVIIHGLVIGALFYLLFSRRCRRSLDKIIGA